MTYQERLFKILQFMHVSEKTSIKSERYNTFVFKVLKYATKTDIKNAINMLFSVKVNDVNTVVIARKNKGSVKKRLGTRNTWKKAYIVLEKGQKIDFINMIE